jgi:hypothetical protein
MMVRTLNALFKEKISPKEKVTHENPELHQFDPLAKSIKTKIADILMGIPQKKYHIEIQTIYDDETLPYVFEFGFMVAIRESKINPFFKDGAMVLNYPKQYIIFVEQNNNIPDNEMVMRVVLWDDNVIEYKVPLLKYWEENIESLEEKQLEALIPLQVFKYRKELERIMTLKKSEKEKRKMIKAVLSEVLETFREVAQTINNLMSDKELLTLHDAKQMTEAVEHLTRYLYHRYDGYSEIEEEANKMTSRMFPPFGEWLEQGREEGMEKGREEGILEIAKKALGKGATIDFVMDITGLARERIEALVAGEGKGPNSVT